MPPQKKNINEKVKLSAKNLSNIEYEGIMNVWRASMLFFEKELRKLSDKKVVGEKTFRQLVKNIDFTELSRIKFDTISEPMKVVKMEDVNRVMGEMAQGRLDTGEIPIDPLKLGRPSSRPTISSDLDRLKSSLSSFPVSSTTPPPPVSSSIRPLASTISSASNLPSSQPTIPSIPINTAATPTIPSAAKSDTHSEQNSNLSSPLNVSSNLTPEDHRTMLAKDTATAVMELRKMMLANLQKFKQQFKEHESK